MRIDETTMTIRGRTLNEQFGTLFAMPTFVRRTAHVVSLVSHRHISTPAPSQSHDTQLNVNLVPQVNELYIDCTGAVRHRQESAFSLSRSPWLHTRTLNTAAMKPHAALICRFNDLHPSYPCNYMDCYSLTDLGRDGRLSRPSWLTTTGHFNHWVVTCEP